MKDFVVIYEWTGNNYSAYAPDLPGCVACGDTLEETERLMKEAIQLYVEAMKKEGHPISEPTTVAKPARVPDRFFHRKEVRTMGEITAVSRRR